MAGETRSFGAGGEDVLLIRVAPEAPIAIEPEGTQTPHAFTLSQNYPNPFNPSTTFRFALPHAAVVRLVVFDLQGREVAWLLDSDWPAGYHHAVWDGRLANGQPAPSGVYIARLVTQADTQSIKMVLLR